MTSFPNVPIQSQAKTMHSEDAMAKLWPGEFHLAVKGTVPITNQSIPELTQLECDTVQLQSEGEHCRLPPANAPTHWHYNQSLPALWGGGQTHTELLPVAVILQGWIVLMYSHRLNNSIQNIIQPSCLCKTINLNQVAQSFVSSLGSHPWEACSVWYRTRQATRQKVSRISILFANTY